MNAYYYADPSNPIGTYRALFYDVKTNINKFKAQIILGLMLNTFFF